MHPSYIGRITRLVRLSVRPSVCLYDIPYVRTRVRAKERTAYSTVEIGAKLPHGIIVTGVRILSLKRQRSNSRPPNVKTSTSGVTAGAGGSRSGASVGSSADCKL